MICLFFEGFFSLDKRPVKIRVVVVTVISTHVPVPRRVLQKSKEHGADSELVRASL